MIEWVLAAATAVALLLQTAPAPHPALDAIDRDIRAGVYGSVDRLLVIRRGTVIADHTYPRDYRTISRGRRVCLERVRRRREEPRDAAHGCAHISLTSFGRS